VIAVAPPALASSIFLIPNGTFFVELIIFVIVLVVFGWYVGPAVAKALREREEMVKREAEEGRRATERLALAERRYSESLSEARAESGRIRDTARAEGQQIIDELRGQATEEANAISGRAGEELAMQREQATRELQSHVRELAGTLAGRIVGEEISVSEGRR
jgi:F-type H+-transporting ATPase subunit b